MSRPYSQGVACASGSNLRFHERLRLPSQLLLFFPEGQRLSP